MSLGSHPLSYPCLVTLTRVCPDVEPIKNAVVLRVSSSSWLPSVFHRVLVHSAGEEQMSDSF